MFDPATDGPAAIRGGCARCQDLQIIFENHQRTLRLMRTFAPPATTQPRKAPKDDGQQDLFGSL